MRAARLQPGEYPALSAGVCAILANLPAAPARPGMLVGMADLARRQETTAEIEADMQADRIERCCTLEFACGRPQPATLQGRRAAEINAARTWTPEMRARAAEAQRRRGERQRAQRAELAAATGDEAELEAVARAEEKAARTAAAAARAAPVPSVPVDPKVAAERAYRRELAAKRKVEPRPTAATCKVCKKEFPVAPRGHVQKYCGQACRRAEMEARAREARALIRAQQAPKKCAWCGGPITPRRTPRPGAWPKYCRPSCAQKGRRATKGAVVPRVCAEPGCDEPINEKLGVCKGHRAVLRCSRCRREIKKARNRAAYAKLKFKGHRDDA